MSQGSFSPKNRFLGQKVCSVAREQTTHRHTLTWIQRTSFQGFRNFSFNISSRIGPTNKVHVQYRLIVLTAPVYQTPKVPSCFPPAARLLSSGWVLSRRHWNCRLWWGNCWVCSGKHGSPCHVTSQISRCRRSSVDCARTICLKSRSKSDHHSQPCCKQCMLSVLFVCQSQII